MRIDRTVGNHLLGAGGRDDHDRCRRRLLRLSQELAHGTIVVIMPAMLKGCEALVGGSRVARPACMPVSRIAGFPGILVGACSRAQVLFVTVLQQVQALPAGGQEPERGDEDAGNQSVWKSAHDLGTASNSRRTGMTPRPE